MEIDAFYTFTIAVILLLTGKIATLNAPLLRKYSIPEPVIGGFLCTAVVALSYTLFDRPVTFDLAMRDFLLLLFFAGIGLKPRSRCFWPAAGRWSSCCRSLSS